MILVFVETGPGGATEVSLETVTFARGLGGPVHAVVVGELPDGVAEQLGAYGVAALHVATGEAVAAYGGAAWAAAVEQVRTAAGADVVTAAGTPRGMEVLAHLATRLGVAMAANAVGVESDPGAAGSLLVTRQVVGGAVLEQMRLDDRPAVFTVAGHAVEAQPAVAVEAATVHEHVPEVADDDPRRGQGARTTSRSARPAAGSPPRSTSRAASAGRSSTGPAAPAPRPSSRSIPTRTPRWSPRRPTP